MAHTRSNSLTSRPNTRRPASLVCQPLVTNLYILFHSKSARVPYQTPGVPRSNSAWAGILARIPHKFGRDGTRIIATPGASPRNPKATTGAPRLLIEFIRLFFHEKA
jgi:hypothetical protein